jgi:hypothetical protein
MVEKEIYGLLGEGVLPLVITVAKGQHTNFSAKQNCKWLHFFFASNQKSESIPCPY